MPRLPASLTWRFGDYRPPPAIRELEGTPITWTESIADRATSRLLSQFREKPRLVGFIRAVIGAGVQDFHDAAYQALTERWIDTAIGAQLDRIGFVVDLPRSGWPDETYRQLLRAQILVLRSSGRWGDFRAVLRVLGGTMPLIRMRGSGTAAATVITGDAWDETNIVGRLVFSLINRAKPAGVRLILEYPTAAPSDSFTTSTSAVPERSDEQGLGDFDNKTLGGSFASAIPSITTETY